MMELSEWIAFYEKHTKETFQRHNAFDMYFTPDKGFCEYSIADNNVYIWQLCGDVDYWVKIAYDFAVEHKLEAISAIILRKPKPFIRRLGFKIVTVENRNGDIRYTAKNKKGETLTATPHGKVYTFTWRVKHEV